MFPYNRYFAEIRHHNKELPLQLQNHLRAGRTKRAIQQIDRELKKSQNLLFANQLTALKNEIVNSHQENFNRHENVKSLSRRVKLLNKLKSSQSKQIHHKLIRKNMKQRFNSDIANLKQQLQEIDHKKHNKKMKNENSEIPLRFQNLQFGGANGNRIQKVASTTRKTISTYELKFHADNYRFDYSENRIKALVHLLSKSVNERVEFYQQQINQAFAEHHHVIKVQERIFCLFEKVDSESQEPATGFVVPKEDSHYAKMLNHTFFVSSNILETLNGTTHTFRTYWAMAKFLISERLRNSASTSQVYFANF